MTRYSKSEVTESLARLRDLLPRGSTVFTIIRSVSRSGMSRQISLFARDKDGDMIPISWHAARVLGWSINDGRQHWALKVSGCGMDMCFHTVMSLSYALHGHGRNQETDHPSVFYSEDRRNGRAIQADGTFKPGYSLTYRDL